MAPIWRNLRGEFIENLETKIAQDIKNYCEGFELEASVGCDSQVRKFKKKKGRFITYITALVIRKLTPGQKWETDNERRNRHGNGALCYYIKETDPLLNISIEERLIGETEKSVYWAPILDEILVNYEACIYDIHLDLNQDKKHLSNKVLNQCKGWVQGIGYDAVLKPDSFVSSKVADRRTRK